MNHASSPRRLAAFLLAFVTLFTPLAAPATPSMGSYRKGVIIQVNHPSRQMMFREDGGSTRTLVYTSDAEFWQGAACASPTALRPGMRVKLRLHQPLFGPDFARTIWLLGAAPSR